MNQFKRKLTAFTAMLAFLSLSSTVAFAGGIDTSANNVLGKTDNMSFTDTSSTRTDVNIKGAAGAVGQVDWKDFSIADGKQVNFGFSGLSQTIINRVLGGKTSEIMGRMTSSCIGTGTCSSYNETSKVLLINPAGVLFGAGSQVDINSLTTSTFDMQGAKNLKGLSATDLANYQNNVLNKAATNVQLNSNYTEAFKAAGIANPDQMIQNSLIKLDGATFSHWARDGQNNFMFNQELTDSQNTNKSLAFVANKIDYKDSLLRTGGNYNYIATRSDGTKVPYSYSNVKLITADGVSFSYLGNGYINNHGIATTDNHPNLARTITMDNSGVLAKDATKAAIVSGSVDIHQKSSVANGTQPSVKIKDTIIKGQKLVNQSNGNIYITASQDVLVDNSRLQTNNTTASYDGASATTVNNRGGEVYIESDKNATVSNSNIVTAGGEVDSSVTQNAGAVRVIAKGGNANVTNTKVLADGRLQVKASGKTTVNNSLLNAYNTTDTSTDKDLTVVGVKGIDITNADLNAKGNLTVLAGNESDGKLTGDINITGTSAKSSATNDANQPGVKAGKKLTIQGKNTTIDNVTLAYNNTSDLSFYDATKSGADYTNNVTIKNNTAFTPTNSNDITVETNGNLTFDNATVQKQNFEITNVQDNKTVNGISYETPSNPTRTNANNINIKSTTGNVTVTNGSNINATNNTTVEAAKNYNQDFNSKMTAGNDIKITAKDNASVVSGSTVQGGHDASITATNGNIEINASNVSAKTNNVTLAANNGKIDITSGMYNLHPGEAPGGAIFESNIEAANDVDITAKNDVTVTGSNVIAGSDSQGFDITHDSADTIGDANITSTNGSVTIQTESKVTSQDKDVNITANKEIRLVDGSKVDAVNDATMTAGSNVEIAGLYDGGSPESVSVTAGNDAKITSTNGNIDITHADVIAKANNASLIAQNGQIYARVAKIEAGNDANVLAKNDVTFTGSNVIAGSDTAGYDVTKDANDTIGSANVTSTNGSVNIKNGSKVLSQDKDVNITAYNTVKFGNASGDNIDNTADITALHNVNVKSTNGNIEGEKTTMPTIKYGDRLTFDANKSNIFTSQDSLKSVNVDYKAGVSNQIYTQGDAQFVNSSFEAPNNFVESGKDVILNNLQIKQATSNPKDTVTDINANGNVTTYNVTGEDLGAKDAGNYHSYPQSVDTNRVAKGDKTMPEYVKGLDSTTLDVNKTKLKVTTDTVKDAANPDNGSITLVLQNADNDKAGVELKARNVKALDKDSTDGYFKSGYYKAGDPQWDENIDPKEGPEIVLNATDDKIAVKELYSDKLTLDPKDKMFADKTNGTPVITVKDQGGLNLDPTLDYDDGTPDGFTYDKNYDTKDKTVTGGDLTLDDWSEWEPTGRTWSDPDGTLHTEYERTRDGKITDRITTQTDQRHTITFDNEGNPGEFTLVYDKRSTTVEPGRDITAQGVKDDPSIIPDIKKDDGTPLTPDDFIETKDDITPCPPTPEFDAPDTSVSVSTDDVSLVRLPREQVEISKTSTVADNTADQTSSIMSAAAKVDLSSDADATYDDDKDDDIE